MPPRPEILNTATGESNASPTRILSLNRPLVPQGAHQEYTTGNTECSQHTRKWKTQKTSFALKVAKVLKCGSTWEASLRCYRNHRRPQKTLGKPKPETQEAEKIAYSHPSSVCALSQRICDGCLTATSIPNIPALVSDKVRHTRRQRQMTRLSCWTTLTNLGRLLLPGMVVNGCHLQTTLLSFAPLWCPLL